MADNTPNVIGLNQIKAKMKTKKAQVAAKLPQALAIAGLFLQRESQLLVPVDFGILKASAFTRSEGKGFATVVNIGYTANYAMFVHEMLSGLDPGRFGRPRVAPSKGNYWDPSGRGQSKFLEQPARNESNRTKMLNIVRNVLKLSDKDNAGISGGGKA
jgi:hypothetical protein